MSSLTPMASAGCWPPRKNSPWGGSEGEFRARLLGLAVLVFRGDRAKDADLLVLRQENCAARTSACGVPELSHRSWPGLLCGSFVFVDEAAEDGPTLDAFQRQVRDRVIWPRRVESAAAMGSPSVVVGLILS